MRSRRQILLALTVLLASFLAGFVLIRGPRALPVGAAAPVRVAAVVAPGLPAATAAPAPSRTPRRSVRRTETVIDVPGAEPQMGSIALTTAEEYRRRARFPRFSQPIDDGADPIERDREVSPGRSRGPDGHDPTLVVYPARTSFEAPQPIVLHAYLAHDGDKVEAKAITGEVRNQEGTVLAGLTYEDDGRNGDAQAGDRIYTAVLAPARERARELKGAQLVEVHAETLRGEERVATTGFLYSVPLARLTGRYRDALVAGSLEIAAEVTVEEAGRFHLEATLAAADGTPIAWAQNALALEPGTAWIPLTFFGLVLLEQGVAGPYVLRSVALATTGEMPNQMNDVAERPYQTRAYQLAQFSDAPYNDPDLLEAAARLEADAGFAPGLEVGAR